MKVGIGPFIKLTRLYIHCEPGWGVDPNYRKLLRVILFAFSWEMKRNLIRQALSFAVYPIVSFISLDMQAPAEKVLGP